MNDDEYEETRLKGELEQLKRERESEKKSMWGVWFLAIWLLPLFGIWLWRATTYRRRPGPDFPVVRHMSVWGYWFLGVPLVTFLYRKFMRQSSP